MYINVYICTCARDCLHINVCGNYCNDGELIIVEGHDLCIIPHRYAF